MQITWITGAPRCGTHLVGMLADGHPQIYSFPVELGLVKEWNKLLSLASPDGQHLTGYILDKFMLSKYLRKNEIKTAFSNSPAKASQL